MNLYSRLYRYQSREKSQLENFCTEAFCDILNRLSFEDTNYLFNCIGLPGSDSVEELVWQTQYRINLQSTEKINSNYSYSIPDLVGIVDGCVKYIIEIKIDAGFTDNTDGENDNDVAYSGQLHRYGKWLSENASNPDDCFLILLTHRTQPNEDFFDAQTESYSISFNNRKLIYWQKIFEIFSKISKENDTLITEFNGFLLEKGLAMELPKRSDFAVLELMMNGSGQRLEFLMTTLYSKLKDKHGKNSLLNFSKNDKFKNEGWAFIWDRGLNSSFIEFKNLPLYFNWGFHFPEYDAEYDDNDTTPIFYVELIQSNQISNLREIIDSLDKHDVLKGKQLADFEFDGGFIGEITISVETITIDELLKNNYNFDSLFEFVSDFMDKILKTLLKFD